MDVGLRAWVEGDLPLLLRLLGDPAMTAYIGGPETPEQIRARHLRYCQMHDKGQMYVVLLAGTVGKAAGAVGYWEKDWRGEAVWETGWHMLPEFQGQGIASTATALVIEQARAAGTHRYLHAFPSIENAPSNGVCRKLGMTLLGEYEFEYPKGHFMRCNDWRFDLFGDAGA